METVDAAPDYEAGWACIPVVALAPGEKCERCWNRRESVGLVSDHPTICFDCRSTVEALLLKRRIATSAGRRTAYMQMSRPTALIQRWRMAFD